MEAEREATLERLADENGTLRARLRGVAHSPLSDSEKRQLLLAPAPRRMHSSAPASIALAHNVSKRGRQRDHQLCELYEPLHNLYKRLPNAFVRSHPLM